MRPTIFLPLEDRDFNNVVKFAYILQNIERCLHVHIDVSEYDSLNLKIKDQIVEYFIQDPVNLYSLSRIKAKIILRMIRVSKRFLLP